MLSPFDRTKTPAQLEAESRTHELMADEESQDAWDILAGCDPLTLPCSVGTFPMHRVANPE